jgi:hypothetical protein
MAGKQKRLALLFTFAVMFFSVLSVTLTSTHVYADYPANNGACNGTDTPYQDTSVPGVTKTMCKTVQQANGTQPNAATTQNPTGTTCAVEKVGWIVCPIVEQSAKAADNLFKFLANNFLQIEPELLTANPTCNSQNKCGTIGVWEQARNLANIMFVIAFIFVIYSQITGAGLNNYGIKRMLPRLIVAAIAVNVSYYICQAMVDLSNLLGFNIMRALVDSAHASGPVVFENTQGTNTQTSDGILGSIATGALVAAGLIWLILAVMSGSIFIVLMVCLVIVIILLLRKAFIILLVVISPFAFVAYLLPNTEKLFSKWLNMFWQLLMVFPIVALLLGGGQLASAIILNAATAGNNPEVTYDPKCDPNGKSNDGGYQTPCEGTVPVTVVKPDGSTEKKNAGWTMGLVAAGISVAPLLAVWAVLKGALSAAGAIGGKIAGAVQKGGAGIGGSGAKGMVGARKRAQEGYKNSTFGKMRAREKKTREGEIKAGAYTGKHPWRKARNRANAAFNNMGSDVMDTDDKDLGIVARNRKRFGAQRERGSTQERSERTREKAEEFTGTGQYESEFASAQRDFNSAKNKHGRDEAMIKMNAAMIAAGRHDDREAQQRMRPDMRVAQQLNNPRSGVGRGDASNNALAEHQAYAEGDRRTATSNFAGAQAAHQAALAAHESGNQAIADHQRQIDAHHADVQYRANLAALGQPLPTTPITPLPTTPAPGPAPAHPGPAPTPPPPGP